MSVKIKYKNAEIANIDTTSNKTIKTKGKYCEDDLVIENTQDGGITPTGTISITANGEYDVAEYGTANVNVSGGGTTPMFTGHYDSTGLKQIGWSDEEIAYYQENGVQWNEENDEYFVLNEDDIAGNLGTTTRFLPKSSVLTSFESYYQLIAIPQINIDSKTSATSMFTACYSLKAIPKLNTSNITNTSYMFRCCYSLNTIPELDTSKVTAMSYMFNSCYSLNTIPELDTSKVTNMTSMFNGCYSLNTIPELDISKVTNTSVMFNGCYSLVGLPQLNMKSTRNISSMFASCSSLTTIKGFNNLGEGYLTTSSSSYANYTLSLTGCPLLTHDSIINVFNSICDIATRGCKSQKITLGSTNLAKVTDEEIAIATAKGWTVSL